MACCSDPPTTPHQAQQLMAINVWFLWQGANFIVPMKTLQRTKHEVGWGLPNFEVKC